LINKGFSEHKQCDNGGNYGNSDNGRSRTEGSSGGSVSMGTKKDESSTGRVGAVGFHRVTARSRLAGFLKLKDSLFI
jgi:hypothetical protein